MVEKSRGMDRNQSSFIPFERSEVFKAIALTARDGIIVIDGSFRVVFWNRAACYMFGYQEEEVLGSGIKQFLASPSFNYFLKKVSAEFGEEKSRNTCGDACELKAVRKSGQLFPVELSISSFAIAGEPFVAVIVRDITERKRMETALQTSQSLYRAIVEDQTELICRWIPDGTIVFANEAYCRYFGKSWTELVGSSFMPLIPDEDQEIVIQKIASLNPCNPVVSYENRAILQNGEIRWQQWTDRAMFNSSGQISEIQSVGRDVSERHSMMEELKRHQHHLEELVKKRTEELEAANEQLKQKVLELEQAEQKLRQQMAAIEASVDGISILNEDEVYIYVNRAYAAIHGYENPEELIGESWKSLYPEDELEKLQKNVTLSFKKYGHWQGEAVGRRRDGTVYPKEVSLTAIKEGGIICTTRDITERRETEDALRDSRQRLADIINFLPDPTVVIDLDGRVIAWNQAIEEMTGVRAEEIMGKGDFEYALPFYGTRRPVLIDLVFRSQPDIEREYVFVRKDRQGVIAESYVPCIKGVGAVLWGKATPLYDSRGNVVGAIESIRDITEPKKEEKEKLQARERLAQAEKMASLGIVAAGIAHEINQPLNSLKVAADSLLYWYRRGKTLDMDRVIDSLQKISVQADRIDSYIKSIRSVIHAEQRPRKTFCSFNDAVKNALDMLSEQLEFSRIKVIKNLDNELPLILGENARLEEIIINLLLNAIQSINDSGKEERRILCTTKATEGIIIEVSDSGGGVREEIKGRIFDPFFTTRWGGEGMGLGLAIVHSIVSSYSGVINVEGNEWGGATFRIDIPLNINSAAAEANQ